ncbi:MAG: single-stranded-DNA-specific exonuclease RecJ [Opitutales bacterium]
MGKHKGGVSPERAKKKTYVASSSMLWTTIDTDEAIARKLSAGLKVSDTMGRLLAQRGLATVQQAKAYLRPRLDSLEDPFALEHMDAAVRRVLAAIENVETIVIFGDYDVDGVTSTVQLVRLLRMLGAEPRFCVPRRMEEGYGLSRRAIDRVCGDVPSGLFIALDCGTNAHEPLEYLKERGFDVVVVDHHQAKAELPQGCILVNPHVNDLPAAPWRDLCAAGLVFKLLHGLLKRLREAGDTRVDTIQLKEFLDLVALGTIADLVPLEQENRILSWFGLRHLRSNGRCGVRALAEVSGIPNGQELGSMDIAFKLGPRINASGRLADASLPIDLLLSEDPDVCRKIAEQLDGMNRERQSIERSITKEAENRAAELFADAPGIVLYDPEWHAGVVGIVASRVSRSFHKPCVVLGADGEMAKGSARSVASVDLVKVFQHCADVLGHWGGHPMAAGLSLDAEQVEAFTARFMEGLKQLYPDGLPGPVLELAAWVHPDELQWFLLEELDLLHPFGQGNAEPVFGVSGVVLESSPQPFGRGHYRFQLPFDDGAVSGVAWRMKNVPQPGIPVDLAVRFSWNHWKSNRYPQLTLVDWKEAGNSQWLRDAETCDQANQRDIELTGGSYSSMHASKFSDKR